MSPDEVEYCSRWLDYYQFGASQDGVTDAGEIVGCLKEFKEQQESGKTDFVLPPIPEMK
jgi:hypothetical protein